MRVESFSKRANEINDLEDVKDRPWVELFEDFERCKKLKADCPNQS